MADRGCNPCFESADAQNRFGELPTRLPAGPNPVGDVLRLPFGLRGGMLVVNNFDLKPSRAGATKRCAANSSHPNSGVEIIVPGLGLLSEQDPLCG